MSTDVEFSKTQISNVIQSHWLGNLSRETLKNIAIPLARDKLLGLMSNST